MQRILTPIKAIRAYCLWCLNEQQQEVRLCPSVKCPLYPYRMGHRPQKQAAGGGAVVLTPVKAIRSKCLDCSGFSTKDARTCPFIDCSLSCYRMGHRPPKVDQGDQMKQSNKQEGKI